MSKIKKQEMPEIMLQNEKYQKDLVYCASDNTFYLYQKGWYKALPKKNMLSEIRNFLISNSETNKMDLGLHVYKDVFEQLILSLVYIGSVEESFLLEYMALNNYMFNFKTLQHELINDNDRKFTPFHLDYDWDDLKIDKTVDFKGLTDYAPSFCNFLKTSICFKDTLETDYGTIDVIQEMMGYYLTGTPKKTVAFFLIGNGANGKSVLAEVVRNMFPKEYVSANSLEELTTDSTRLASLVGKKLNIASEEESKKMKNDKFKALVSGDPIQARRLYEESFTFVPTCKFLFLTNKAPRFQSVDNGIKRRVEIIHFPRDFKEIEQDRSLVSKIKKEMAVIVGWAINGAKRLIKNNYVFTTTEATLNAKKSFISEMSTALTFVTENYDKVDLKPSEGMKGTDLYNAYKIWMEEVGKQKGTLGRDNFYDHLNRNNWGGYKYRTMQYFKLIRKSNLSTEADADDDINVDDIGF